MVRCADKSAGRVASSECRRSTCREESAEVREGSGAGGCQRSGYASMYTLTGHRAERPCTKSSFLGVLVCPHPILVRLPLQVDEVSVKRVRFLLRHRGVDPRPARGRAVFRHAVPQIASAQNYRVEPLMNIERHVAEIGNLTFERPRTAPVRLRRMTLVTEEFGVYARALLNLFWCGCLLGWLRHCGNVGLNRRHRPFATELERQQTRRAAFRLQRRHIAHAPE